MSGETPIPVLVARLSAPREATRRIAVHDLIAISAREPRSAEEARQALLAHLQRERDPKAAALIARHFGESLWRPALTTLRALYDDPGVPVEIAHAAILAHDRIEAAGRAP